MIGILPASKSLVSAHRIKQMRIVVAQCAEQHGCDKIEPELRISHQRREAIARGETGDKTLTDIAHSYNVSHSTIGRR